MRLKTLEVFDLTPYPSNPKFSPMRFLILLLLFLPLACTSDAPPMGMQINNRDSLPVMETRGVSKLISDSGIVRYKVIAEEWRVYDKTMPQRQEFPKGVYLERYDNNQSANLFITADTAYCFDQYLWKLRGRVLMNDRQKQVTYTSEELYWDMREHKFYSNVPMKIQEPDRLIQGDRFESNEQMTTYKVSRSSGYMPLNDSASKPDSVTTTKPAIALDSVKESKLGKPIKSTPEKPVLQQKSKSKSQMPQFNQQPLKLKSRFGDKQRATPSR